MEVYPMTEVPPGTTFTAPPLDDNFEVFKPPPAYIVELISLVLAIFDLSMFSWYFDWIKCFKFLFSVVIAINDI